MSKLKSYITNKKGQLGSLTPAVLTLLSLAVVIAVTFIILNNFRDTQLNALNTAGCGGNESDAAFRSVCNMTSALNDNLVANLSIIVIVVVFAVVLGLIAFFRTAGSR